MALLKFKRSAVPGKVPTLADLSLGELAINTFDGKVYIRKDSGTASIVEVGGGSGVLSFNSRTGAVTLTSGDVTGALGFTPYNSSNPAGYITSSGSITGSAGSAANITGGNQTGSYEVTSGQFTRFGHANQTDVNDGKIGAALFASGLNIVGTQTSAGTGRQIRLWGALIDNAGIEYVRNTGTWSINVTGNAATVSSITSGQVTTALGYTPANRAGDTFTGPVTINSGASAQALSLNATADTFLNFRINSADSAYVQSSAGGMYVWNRQNTPMFVGTNNATRLTIGSGGDVTANIDLRAPIFYDSNNTAFYTDPASTSVLNTVNLSRINMANSNSVYADGDGNAGWRFGGTGYVYLNQAGLTYAQTAIVARGGVSNDSAGLLTLLGGTSGGTQINTDTRSPIYYDSNNTAFYVDPASGSRLGGQVTFNGGTNIASNGDVYARRDSGATGVYYFADGGSKFLFWDGTRYLFGSAGPVDAAVSYRAPFFYDLDNTGYFANPAGTSVFFNFDNINQRCAYNRAWDNFPSITVYNTTDQGPQGDFRIHGAPGSSGGDFNVRLLVDGNIHTLSDLVAGGGCYAQIYYDTNNTGYYVDPTGGTSLRTYGDWRADSAPWTGEFNGKIQYHANNWYFQGSSNWEFRRSDTANAFFVNQNGECTARSDYRAPIYYDSNDTFFYLNPAGYSQINGFGSVNGSAGVGMSVMGNPSNGAIMSFHRSAAFAINMGLDTDNVFRMGGWSAAANRLQMDMNGNLTMAGNVTAYSDARLKRDVETIDGALDLVSKMRGVRYTRIDTENRNVGVIAQEMLEVLPEVVQQGVGDDDTLSVAYGNLVGVLIEAIKELRAEVEELKATTSTITFEG